MANGADQFDGPIPGQNYTSDTKNYPWHRPPQFSDLDDAIEYIAGRLTNEESSVGLLVMMEQGIPILDLVQMFLMSGVGAGKWTLDFALMLAGPTAHLMTIIGKAYGIQYDLGLEDKSSRPPTGSFFQAVEEINRAKAASAGRRAFDSRQDIEDNTSTVFKDATLQPVAPVVKPRGFLGAENPVEQQQMLGAEQPTQMGA